MESDRGHWYLITALILGLGLGLLMSWVISPHRLQDTHPSDLHSDYKDVYRALIARAYQANQNLARAEARLDLLDDENPAQALAAQAQRSLAERGDQELAKILANLAAALQRTPQPEHTPTSPSPSPTAGGGTPTPEQGTSSALAEQAGTPQGTDQASTSTPQPSPEPSATNAPPFIVQNHGRLCNPDLTTPLIQVYATNANGDGVTGVEIIISWAPDNQETFVTGLKPDIGPGYADFEAQTDVAYTIELPESGLLLSDVSIPSCETDEGDTYPGSYQVFITHPN